MGEYRVDLTALRAAATAVERLGRDVGDATCRRWSIDAAEVGEAELAAALADFHDESRRCTDRLLAAAAEVSGRLSDSAAGYAGAEAANAGLMSDGSADAR